MVNLRDGKLNGDSEQLGREGDGELLFNGHRILFLQSCRVL